MQEKSKNIYTLKMWIGKKTKKTVTWAKTLCKTLPKVKLWNVHFWGYKLYGIVEKYYCESLYRSVACL